MRQAIREGLDLAQQLAALPFKAARAAFQDTDFRQRPLGDVIDESLQLGEGLATLPFKATSALLTEIPSPAKSSLEERVAELERRLNVDSPPPESEPAPAPATQP